MEYKFETRHWLFIILSVMSIALDLYFLYGTRWFKPVLVLSLLLAGSQFLLDFVKENKRQKEIEVKFLEFTRALVQTTKSGISIPKGVVQIANEDYGALSPYVKKLAHQLEWGLTLHEALETFGKNTGNKLIAKSVSIVTEAEKSGGNMGDVLQAVMDSVFSIKKIKEERRASVYSQLVQGYIIYFVFIIIMLVLQIYLIPKIAVLGADLQGGLGSTGLVGESSSQVSIDYLDEIFTWLIVIQGLFAGLMVGKFTEGELKAGIKHAIFLAVAGYLILATAKGI